MHRKKRYAQGKPAALKCNDDVMDVVRARHAIFQNNPNPGMAHGIARAIDSLATFPLPLKSSDDLMLVQGVGSHLASIAQRAIDKRRENWMDGFVEPRVIGSEPLQANHRSAASSLSSMGTPSAVQEGEATTVELQWLQALGPRPAEASTPLPGISISTQLSKRALQGGSLVLVLDTREVQRQSNRDFFAGGLRALGVQVDVRALPLGDVMWVLRADGKEYVMDTIVERKTCFDLAQSIMDGRYDEQKDRLRKSIQQRVVYLVEGNITVNNGTNVTPDALHTACVSTTARHGFLVHNTSSADATVEWLAHMHRGIQAAIQAAVTSVSSPLNQPECFDAGVAWPVTTFEDWGAAVRRSTSKRVRDLLAHMLSQPRSMSAAKAHAVMEEVSAVPSGLHAQLMQRGAGAVEQVLPIGSQRRLGKQTAKLLTQLWTAQNYDAVE